MFCANCSEKIMGDMVMQGGECFCSEECASLAAGIDLDDGNNYFDENDSVEDFFEEYDE